MSCLRQALTRLTDIYRYLRADKVRELIEYYEEALYGDLSGGDLIANGKEREKLKIELFPEGLNLERIKEKMIMNIKKILHTIALIISSLVVGSFFLVLFVVMIHSVFITPHCKFLKIGEEDNCPIAKKLYTVCVEENLVTPVFECPKFEKKVVKKEK